MAEKSNELRKEDYFEQSLDTADASAVKKFVSNFSKYMEGKGLKIHLMAVGSSTFPMEYRKENKIDYKDIDILVIADGAEIIGPLESFLEKVKHGTFSKIMESQNRNARFIPYGRPNVTIGTKGRPIHLVIHAGEHAPDKARTLDEKVYLEQKRNYPFCVLY